MTADLPDGPTARLGPPVGTALSDAAPKPPSCARCHRPLIQRGGDGECLRCLVDFALQPDDEPAAASDLPGWTGPATPTLRYGHFAIDVAADGLPAELGAGAMAVTYRAQDTVLHSTVALKVINKNVAERPEARARFLREARAAANLHHPNVASFSYYGEQDGECYYVVELVAGETLEARVRREGPLPAALVLEIGVQATRALAAAEACGGGASRPQARQHHAHRTAGRGRWQRFAHGQGHRLGLGQGRQRGVGRRPGPDPRRLCGHARSREPGTNGSAGLPAATCPPSRPTETCG